MNFLGIIIMTGIGILLIAIYANGASLVTTTQPNKIESLDISTTTAVTLIEIDLGTASTINSVLLTFRSNIANNTSVTVTIKDSASTQIGSGSKVVSPASSSVTVNLTDTITASERPNVRSVSITV